MSVLAMSRKEETSARFFFSIQAAGPASLWWSRGMSVSFGRMLDGFGASNGEFQMKAIRRV
jgi:hypothetical protein